MDVFVRAGQGVSYGGARRLGLGDPLVEFGELALLQLPPTVDGRRTRGDKRFELAQREADVAQDQDLPDQPNGRERVTPLTRDPRRCR